MTRVVLLIAFCGFLLIPIAGCGGSGENSAVTDNADAEALAEYDRQMEAEEAAGENDGSE
ncbi:MAG: hypothetical protein WBD20_05715 [Pirellulaceae bacterium]